MVYCPITGRPSSSEELAEVRWLSPQVIAYIQRHNPDWRVEHGACPAYVQQMLLEILLSEGRAAFQETVQTQWPLDAEAAFGAIPTPLRLHADPRFTGQNTTIALIDSDFYPHPDLTRPHNRIRAFVDATTDPVRSVQFNRDDEPRWPDWDASHALQWHGTMTATVAAGNGWLSHGLYRGLASDADLILIRAYEAGVGITDTAIIRALTWIRDNADAHNIRVVNLSVSGDAAPEPNNPLDNLIHDLVQCGLSVTAAAGNDGVRQLVPPASSPSALTIGGVDDENDFSDETLRLWHSNYGEGSTGGLKPELVAPSIWVVAPVLPGTDVAREAQDLFEQRGESHAEERIAQLKLITPYYQHVDGTSFAAPIVASTIACMLEANSDLSPQLVRQSLMDTATPIPDVSSNRQGKGVLQAGLAVARATEEGHTFEPFASPVVRDGRTQFLLHAHDVQRVVVYGSWDGWQKPLEASTIEDGLWLVYYDGELQDVEYKFLINERVWLDDPLNPHKRHDAFGGYNSVISG